MMKFFFLYVNVLGVQEIYPGQFEPSISHRFVSLLEKRDQLLRNYTQNIDTLEMAAGLTRVVQCHGEVTKY